jgi:sulfatase modifying factor 1
MNSRPDRFVSPRDGKEMILIPAGEFIMGSDTGSENQKPQRKVYLPDFYISRHPVTNAEFEAFVNATGRVTAAENEGEGEVWIPDKGIFAYTVKGADWRHPCGPRSGIAGKEDHPVVQVSWHDAVAYCEWAGKRLPAEEEWEKAARGTDARAWPWGDEWEPGWCNAQERVGSTTRVGRYSPEGDSPYGVADMAGNVWEWTADWYKAYPGSTYSEDEFGEKYRVVRGGSWLNRVSGTRCAVRFRNAPDSWDNAVGFRVVLSLTDADS